MQTILTIEALAKYVPMLGAASCHGVLPRPMDAGRGGDTISHLRTRPCFTAGYCVK